MSASPVARALAAATEAVDRRVAWHRLPPPIGAAMLIGLRARLRQANLYSTDRAGATTLNGPPPDHRTVDGSGNDPRDDRMGAAGRRFGRNVPIGQTWPEPDERLLAPSPRAVSRELMTRHRFIPATTLNVLAAAWLQFQIHDWFSHGRNEKDSPWRFPLAPDDPWGGDAMEIQRTRRDPTRTPAELGPPTFANTETHWWDASQIYGTTPEFQAALRSGEDGKLRMGDDGLPPLDLERGVDVAGVQGNFWIGLALLHTLFMREHNAICDRLRAEHPTWGDERLFRRARLVNAALLAKIHTVEWTPAIIAHPTTRFAMRANWWGLAGERVARRVGRFRRSDLVSGIPGSATAHHGAPYALTEEFVAVYRMHPLMPDEFEFRDLSRDAPIARHEFPAVVAHHARPRLHEVGVANALYSLGVAHPGAITLHNFPRFLQRFQKVDGTVVDLAAIDILRSRERGVPRYNEFRRRFHLNPVRRWEDLTANRAWAEEIRRVYAGDLERVDLTVGLYAEPPPRGFGFSDTAFRVFALMASRRLKSDRFFTVDYTPRVYTRAGLEWIDRNTMATVLLRHYPQLAPALGRTANAFAPWRRTAA